MSTSAKRLGLEIKGNLELELRLRRIEVELEKRVLRNQDVEDTGRSRGTVPQVTGIRVSGSTPGAVTVAWNAVAISDLRRYDVEFAEDVAFVTNKQTFREGNTFFQFSTASATGGAGGTTFFARVRAINSIQQNGLFSVTLNTTTGQVVAGDIADDAIDTDQIVDGAVTGVKTTGLVSDLTLPGPPFSSGQSDTYLRINTGFTSYISQIGTLPNLATVGNVDEYARVSAADSIVYKEGTLPPLAAIGNVDEYVRVSAADTLIYDAGTLPAVAVTIGTIPRVTGADALAYTSWTIASTFTDTNKLIAVTASNVLGTTAFDFPTTAPAGELIVGDATDYATFNQDPIDAGTEGSESNHGGSVTLPGGFVLQWGTDDVADASDTNVTGLVDQVVNVVASQGESIDAIAIADVAAWVSGTTQITLHQTGPTANREVSWFAISDTNLA